MTRDDFIVGGLVLSFALLVTSHVTLVVGLAGRKPRKRALLALVVAPLAPSWGLREGMRGRAGVWGVSVVVYGVLLVVAMRGGG
jgi:hypothetical protein